MIPGVITITPTRRPCSKPPHTQPPHPHRLTGDTSRYVLLLSAPFPLTDREAEAQREGLYPRWHI